MKRGTRVLLTALCPRCPGEIGKVSSRKQNGWLRVSLESKRLTVSVRNIPGQVSLLNPQEPTHPEERMRDGVQVDMLLLEQNRQVGSQVDCRGWTETPTQISVADKRGREWLQKREEVLAGTWVGGPVYADEIERRPLGRWAKGKVWSEIADMYV